VEREKGGERRGLRMWAERGSAAGGCRLPEKSRSCGLWSVGPRGLGSRESGINGGGREKSISPLSY
jgi:hypothetical protein